MIRSKAFCTPRMPLALETITGLAAQRVVADRGRGGLMACGIAAAVAATAPAWTASDTNSRRVRGSNTG
jgi:hypothetical protein